MDSVSISMIYTYMMYIEYIGICLLDSRSDRVGSTLASSTLHGNGGRRTFPLKWRRLTLNKMNRGKGRFLAQTPTVATKNASENERPIKTKTSRLAIGPAPHSLSRPAPPYCVIMNTLTNDNDNDRHTRRHT